MMNAIDKRLTYSAAILGVTTSLLCLFPDRAEANLTWVEDTAICSPTPTRLYNANIGDSIQNGDCTITRSGYNRTVGNGADEHTTWTFDFSDQINSEITNILEAEFVLSFIPRGVWTDSFKIDGWRGVHYSRWGVGNLPYNQQTELTFNLLDFYEATDIQRLLNENDFKLDMRYGDDAIITQSKLSLLIEEECVPEPSAIMALLAVSALGLGKLRRRRSSF